MEILLLPFGLSFFLFGGYFFLENLRFWMNSRPATGKVVAMEKVPSNTQRGKPSYVYHPVVKYEKEAQKRIFTSQYGHCPPSYKIGEEVPLMISTTYEGARILRIYPFIMAFLSIIVGFLLLVLFLIFVEVTLWKFLLEIVMVGGMVWLIRYILNTEYHITTPEELAKRLRNPSYTPQDFNQQKPEYLIISNKELFEGEARNVGPLKWGGIIFLGIGVGVFCVAAYLGMSKYTFLAKAHSTEGEVIQLDRSLQTKDDGSKVYMYYPIVRYTPDGKTKAIIFNHKTGSNPPSYHLGERVEVLYDPLNPYHAIINGGLMNWFAPGMAGMLGILFIIAGLFMIRMWRGDRQKLKPTWLY